MSETINLFSFPFAGGNSYSYRNIAKHLAGFIDFFPLEYPGRGKRIRESLVSDIDLLVHDAFEKIAPQVRSPYAIFGHSMGAVVGYYFARRLVDAGYPPPARLIFTGRKAPCVPVRKKKHHLMSREELFSTLTEYGGLPKEILESRDALDFFEPVLRADLKAIETFVYEKRPPLDTPMVVMIGENEDITHEEAALWQNETSRPMKMITVAGGHFFINERVEQIARIISECLGESVGERRDI